ncbi:hypothetical protein EN879_31670 [Mesorhizobium sp. M7A.F.Ca.AU.002.02.1.1]|uniref:hypothetical protein n=1 Tax=Mesorhizobium sp. M7A.F.Ca.AU.002.02.1.1 TaxID=2496671 RepID=UPI000FCC05FF|nr:hypothetical protein [Mesorhizobium sp. M7A.F.Ca.AU.002.02.1.1]RVC17457.1 hypothetical protein EN879_31670 [Mesorhizobium sp. M7A.F.Ca.AU.002.02.1.1]
MVAVSALAKRIPAEMTKLLPAAGSVMDDLNEAFRVGSHSNTRAAMCQAVSCPSALAVAIRLAKSAHCRCAPARPPGSTTEIISRWNVTAFRRLVLGFSR